MLLKNKVEKLKTFLNNNNVLTKEEERYCYAYDASNITVEIKIPDIVVFVESAEEVQKIIKYANDHEIPIIARGAGTNMVGACSCTSGGIILNFSKMNKILEFNKTNMTIKVQPGVVLGDLKKFVEKEGLFYPPDPSNFAVSTIGGGIAQSSGGANAFKYGTIKDYILSLKVVTAEGKLITLGANTPKDSTGYHLNQLIVGSEGTLAIVVEATLKLIPKPESRQVISAYFDNIETAVSAVNKIISEHIFPSAIDFMDKNSLLTVEDFAKCGLKTNHEALLLIELDGNTASLNSQLYKVESLLEELDASEIIIAKDETTIDKIWKARRSSYAATSRLAPDVITDDIIVPRENIGKMVNSCKEICNKFNLKVCMVGHIGDGNLHPQIALDLNNEDEFKNYMLAKAKIYEKVIALGGTISAEHGIGSTKLAQAENFLDQNAIELMKLIKKAFDPKNILNPGKIFKL